MPAPLFQTTLPFTPTRPVPFDDDADATVRLTFPIVRTNDQSSSCGPVAVLTLHSPHNLNAMTYDDLQALYTLLEWIDEQAAVQITVLTGRGRFFSAGASFSDPARATTPEEWTTLPADHVKNQSSRRTWTQARTWSTNGMAARVMMQHSKLLVAAMNGPVVGIMAAMVAMCDLIYTYDDFFLLTPFSQLALMCEAGSSVSFPAKMGLGRAQQALIEGRKMPADELLQAGFISKVFPSHARPSSAAAAADDKAFTAPILDDVLAHIGARFLPPAVDMFAVQATKRLLRDTAFAKKNIWEAMVEEVQGAEAVFRSGRPNAQFARLAGGGRHKL